MLRNLDDVQKKEDSLQMYIMKFGLVVQLLYTLSFVRRIRKYVLGQCPSENLSSIGRYRRNVVNLRWEFWCSVLGSCFPGLDYVVRKISMTQTPKFAFIVNFVLLDSMLYLFFIIFFWSVNRQEIPSKKAAAKRCPFYVSYQPKYLEPRRLKQIAPSLAPESVINVSENLFFPNIPLVREIVPFSEGNRQYRVTSYVSTRRDDTLHQRRNGVRLKTSEIDKTFKINKTSKIDKTYKVYKTCKNMQDRPVCTVQLNDAPEVLKSHSDHDNNLLEPCSSKKTFKSTGRFNYMQR